MNELPERFKVHYHNPYYITIQDSGEQHSEWSIGHIDYKLNYIFFPLINNWLI